MPDPAGSNGRDVLDYEDLRRRHLAATRRYAHSLGMFALTLGAGVSLGLWFRNGRALRLVPFVLCLGFLVAEHIHSRRRRDLWPQRVAAATSRERAVAVDVDLPHADATTSKVGFGTIWIRRSGTETSYELSLLDPAQVEEVDELLGSTDQARLDAVAFGDIRPGGIAVVWIAGVTLWPAVPLTAEHRRK